MIDILIKNIDKQLVQSINERAVKKGMSRHAYIKNLIEYDNSVAYLKKQRSEQEMVFKKIADAVLLNGSRINYLSEQIDVLMQIIKTKRSD